MPRLQIVSSDSLSWAWDGVRDPESANFLKQMQLGDQVHVGGGGPATPLAICHWSAMQRRRSFACMPRHRTRPTNDMTNICAHTCACRM